LLKRQEEIVRLQKAFARWQPFADRLAKNDKDAEARLEMGKYHALVKGNWDRGLPLMATGTKGSLQKLCQSDASNPNTAGARSVGALGWYSFATNADTDPGMKTQALLRAYRWYEENLADADDKERGLIEAKLQDISAMLPAEFRIGEIAQELKKIDFASGPVYGCAFSPDGNRLIATGYDGSLRLVNARTFKEFRQLDGHSGKVWCVAFTNNSAFAVSGGFDNTVRLWDLSSGRAVKTFDGHKDYVRSVAVSGDG